MVHTSVTLETLEIPGEAPVAHILLLNEVGDCAGGEVKASCVEEVHRELPKLKAVLLEGTVVSRLELMRPVIAKEVEG